MNREPTVTFALPGTIAGICRLVGSILIRSGQSNFKVFEIRVSSSDANVTVQTDDVGCTVLTKAHRDMTIKQVVDSVEIDDVDHLTRGMRSKFARVSIAVAEYGNGLRQSGFAVHSLESMHRHLKLPGNSECSRLLLKESTFIGSQVHVLEDIPDDKMLILLSPSTEPEQLSSVVKALTISIKE